MTNNTLTMLWMFLLPLLAILIPLWLGQLYGRFVKKRSGEMQDAPISSSVGATLGLFAFMLAFTFQIVGNRFDKRKELFMNEISRIRISYLYAGLTPEPFRSQSRKLISSYVDLRVELRRDLSRYPEIKLKSERILDSLWSFSEALAAQDRSSEAYSLFTSSTADLVALFNERITVMEARLPQVVMYVVSFVAFFSTLMLGYQFGIAGKVSFLMNILFGITFAAVLWLVFALDRPEVGLIQITDAPLRALQQELHR